jgi:Bax protein
MPALRKSSKRRYLLLLILFQTLLSAYADVHAWSRYPGAYPGYWQPPMVYQAVPVAYGVPPWYPAARQAVQRNPPATPARKDAPDSQSDGDKAVRKRAFIEDLLPVVKRENARLVKLRDRLAELQQARSRGRDLTAAQREWLDQLADDYRVDAGLKTDDKLARLLRRIDVIPAGLAVAQAANESAWGQSRFAREGNNLFGTRTWDSDKGIKPNARATGKNHLVRTYDTVAESVRDYMLNLNSHPAYRPLRERRAQLRNSGRPLSAMHLAEGLEDYSELGDEYVRRIQSTIRANDLEQVAGVQVADSSL